MKSKRGKEVWRNDRDKAKEERKEKEGREATIMI